MGARQREWAKRARAQLLKKLGGACVQCGESRSCRLEFDHITPPRWQRNAVEWSARVSRYRQEAKDGLLQILCRRCNARKGQGKLAIDLPPLPQPELDLNLCPF